MTTCNKYLRPASFNAQSFCYKSTNNYHDSFTSVQCLREWVFAKLRSEAYSIQRNHETSQAHTLQFWTW